MILSNVSIQQAIDDGRLVLDPEPFPRAPTQETPDSPYQTSAVDLRLGSEVVVYTGDEDGGKLAPITIDLTQGKFSGLSRAMKSLEITEDQPFALKPNRFVLAKTLERVNLPIQPGEDRTLAARVEGKSSYARCGLLVHFTAPTIHAGYEGTITLEIINLGPYKILLQPGMPICQLVVEEVRGVPFRNDSQFQGQSQAAGVH